MHTVYIYIYIYIYIISYDFTYYKKDITSHMKKAWSHLESS